MLGLIFYFRVIGTFLVFSNFCIEDGVCFPSPNSEREKSKGEPIMPEFDSAAVIFRENEVQPLAPPVDKFGIPECARNNTSNFCEEVPDYPNAEIMNSMSKLSKDAFKVVFSTGLTGRSTYPIGDLSETPLCQSQTRTFRPKAGKTSAKEWVYVVNNIHYEQVVTAETCQDDGGSCRYVSDNLPLGYRSFCRQRYAFKTLLAIKPEDREPYKENFRFPSCCTCYVTVSPEYRRKFVTIHQTSGEPSSGIV
ncbi:neurotrophin 1-like [Tachypleus tridentatus]|uniref:neurotrophin 1-like n=1 Tax=Tachypleus tridentatus TaxID=6853 RepID=UPI003FD18C36